MFNGISMENTKPEPQQILASVESMHFNYLSGRVEQKTQKNNQEQKNNFSFEQDINSMNQPSCNLLQASPRKSPFTQMSGVDLPGGRYALERTGEEQDDFMKAMQGVGNIFRFLGIIQPKVKRFFFTKTMAGKRRQLTVAVRKTINDSSDYEMRQESKNVLKRSFNQIIYLLGRLFAFLRLDQIPIFNPENLMKIIFNCIIVSYNCFYLLIRSLEIFFEAHFGEYQHYFHYIAEAAWVIEMLVQLNTSMYHHNHFTKDRKVIMKIYLEEYFFYEVLPLIFDGKTSDVLVLNILYKLPLILKTKGILIIMKNLEFYILQLLDNHSIFFLLKLIVQIMLFGHFLACAFSLILTYQINYLDVTVETSKWVSLYESEGISWIEKYLRSLYWGFTTMMNTQQYTPSTILELAFTCIVMIVSCVAFGYLLSAIGSILSEISKEQKEYKKDLNILNQFMKRKKIEIGLVRRANIQLQKYYEQQRRVRYLQENQTLKKLNEYMTKELLISSNFKILKRYPFFSHIFTNQTLQKLSTKMQEKLYAPSQIIFDKSVEEQQEDYYLYLIVSGTSNSWGKIYFQNQLIQFLVLVLIEDQFSLTLKKEHKIDNQYQYLSEDQNKVKLEFEEDEENQQEDKKQIGRKMKKGDYFGLQGFFTGKEIMHKVVSQDFSSVMVISRRDVEKILQEEKRDFERYREIVDKITLSNDYNDLKTQCHYCTSKYHSTYQCSKVFYDKDPFYIIQRQMFSFPQDRKIYFRVKNKTRNALISMEQVIQDAVNIKIEYQLDDFNENFSDITHSDEESSPIDNDNSISTRNPTKQKTNLNAEKIYNDAIYEEYKPTELSKETSLNNFNESNVHVQFPIAQQQTDDEIYCENQQSKPFNKIVSENMSSTLDVPDRYTTTERGGGGGTTINIPTSIKRGSIEGTMYALPKAASNMNAAKTDIILKQMIEQMQHLINNMNNPRGGRGKQGTLIGSNMDNNQKIIGGSNLNINLNNNGTIFSRKGTKERTFKTHQLEELNTGVFSRKSGLRSTLRQPSLINPNKRTTFIDNLSRDASSGNKLLTYPLQPQSIFNVDLLSTMRVFGDLDRMQIFDYYFPHQNAHQIIQKINIIIQKNARKIKPKKLKPHLSRKSITLTSNKGDRNSRSGRGNIQLLKNS